MTGPTLKEAVLSGDPLTRRRALAQIGRLLGGGASLVALGSLAVACDDESGSRTRIDGGRSFLSTRQRDLLANITDHLIPPTDTPGARDAGVPEFIEIVLRESFRPEQRNAFLEGLSEPDKRAQSSFGMDYLACSAEQQRAVLRGLDDDAYRAAPDPARSRRGGEERSAEKSAAGSRPDPAGVDDEAIQWRWAEERSPSSGGIAFWPTLKRLTLVGYYTSEVGATQELRYVALPGRYDGCTEVGRTWAA